MKDLGFVRRARSDLDNPDHSLIAVARGPSIHFRGPLKLSSSKAIVRFLQGHPLGKRALDNPEHTLSSRIVFLLGFSGSNFIRPIPVVRGRQSKDQKYTKSSTNWFRTIRLK